MTTISQARIYRTTDGHFVGEGDPRGAFLAYGAGATVADADVARYTRFMAGEPQDALDSGTLAAQAYTDEAARDLLRRRQAGDPAAQTPPGQTPPLIHDKLATELADEAQAIAAQDPAGVAALRNEQEGDEVFAEHEVWRTAEGDLVHAGDEAGATLAYAVGARIDDADVDEYNDLGAPASEDPPAAKAAPRSRNKAQARTADK